MLAFPVHRLASATTTVCNCLQCFSQAKWPGAQGRSMSGPLKIVLSQKFIADRGLNKKLKTIDKVLENNGKTKVLNFQFLGF